MMQFSILGWLMAILVFGWVEANNHAVMMDKAAKSLEIVDQTVQDVVKVINDANPAAMFANLSKALSALGPVFMAVSCIISIVSIFHPPVESEEMRVLREGFEKVNTRIDGMKGAVEEIKIIAQLSSAKVTVISAFDAVDTMEGELLIAQKRGTKQAWSYFQGRFQREYKFAADKVYNSLYGSKWDSDFRFDLLDIMREKFKCSPAVITRICLVGMQTINRAIALEAAYLGSIKYPARVKVLRKVWHIRLENLRQRCGDMLNNCEAGWQTYARKAFEDYYNDNVYMVDNAELAEGLYNTLTMIAPTIHWGVYVADGKDYGKFNVLTTATEKSFIEQNNKQGKNLAIFKLEPSFTLPDSTLKDNEKLKNDLLQDTCCFFTCQGKFYFGTSSVFFSHLKKQWRDASIVVGHMGENAHFVAPADKLVKLEIPSTYCTPGNRYIYLAQ